MAIKIFNPPKIWSDKFKLVTFELVMIEKQPFTKATYQESTRDIFSLHQVRVNQVITLYFDSNGTAYEAVQAL